MEQSKQEKLFSEFPPVSTQAWEEKILADLKGADYQKKLIWNTGEGFEVRPYYRAEDLQGLDYLKSLPGNSPFVRGARETDNNWIIRQDIHGLEPGELNSHAAEAIAKGADAVGLPAAGVTTEDQMERLLRGIDLKKTEVVFLSSRSFPSTLGLLDKEMARRNESGEKIKGSLNFDPVGYLLVHGGFYQDWDRNLEEAVYLLKTAGQKYPLMKVITVNGHYFQNSGSTLVQELAFSLASANEYLAGLTDKGLTVDEIAPGMMLSLATGSNYFMEIAKFRAARLLWTRMVEQYHPAGEKPLRIFIHATSALWNKSIYDPYVNMLRTTTEGMSAALGNADSVSILPFNITYREPDDFSSRIAFNQQLILKQESYLDKIVDPAGGSYYIEKLTHSIAHHAWDLFRAVESRGGMIACIKSGFIQDEVEQSRRHKEMDIAQRKTVILGTNQFPNISETMAEKIRTVEKTGTEQPSSFRKLMPFRGSRAFEEVRLATETHVKKGNRRPLVFLFTMGNLAMLRARAGFTTNFFGCAGYDILDNQGFATVEEGVAAALGSGADIVVFCGSDDDYVSIVPEAAQKLKGAGKGISIVVAGYPKEHIEAFKSAGVSDFIHIRSNLLETLKDFQKRLGIL